MPSVSWVKTMIHSPKLVGSNQIAPVKVSFKAIFLLEEAIFPNQISGLTKEVLAQPVSITKKKRWRSIKLKLYRLKEVRIMNPVDNKSPYFLST